MGCDWVAVRNLAITLGVFVGLGTSSVIFALSWWRFSPEWPWKKWVTSAAWGSAAAWLATAIVFLAILMAVVGSFCRCSEAVAACAAACGSMDMALKTLLGVMAGLAALCTVLAAEPTLILQPWLAVALAFALSGTIVAMGIVAYYAAQIAGCQ